MSETASTDPNAIGQDKDIKDIVEGRGYIEPLGDPDASGTFTFVRDWTLRTWTPPTWTHDIPSAAGTFETFTLPWPPTSQTWPGPTFKNEPPPIETLGGGGNYPSTRVTADTAEELEKILQIQKGYFDAQRQLQKDSLATQRQIQKNTLDAQRTLELEKTKRLWLILTVVSILVALTLITFAPEERETLSYWLGAALVLFAAGAAGYRRVWATALGTSLTADRTNPAPDNPEG
jgi:hypothetical protein